MTFTIPTDKGCPLFKKEEDREEEEAGEGEAGEGEAGGERARRQQPPSVLLSCDLPDLRSYHPAK